MKKIKNMFSKITEKTILLLMVLSLAINNFVPIMAVYAEGEEPTPIAITLTADTGITLSVNPGDDHRITISGEGIKGEIYLSKDGQNGSTGNSATVNSQGTGTLSTAVVEGETYKINYNGDITVKNDGTPVASGSTVTANATYHIAKNIPPVEPGEGAGEFEPEKTVYDFKLNGKTFTNVDPMEPLNVPSDFNFDSLTEFYVTKIVVGENEEARTFTYNENEYSLALKDVEDRPIFEANLDKLSDNYANLRVESHAEDIKEEDKVAGREYYGFYITELKLVKEGFKGVSITTNKMPDNYDFTVWTGIDLKGTTEAKPSETSVYYGQDTITISSEVSSQVSKIELVSNKGVPASAVEINSREGKVKIKSNYYSEIPLKITLQDGTVGYANIKRIGLFIDNLPKGADTLYHGAALRISGNMNVDTDKQRIAAVFYHDDTTTYQDYDLIVNITYKDGREETKLAKGVGDVTNDRTHLTGSDYLLWSGDDVGVVKNVYVTAVKKGAISKDSFGGATFGSGAGVEWVNNR